MSDYEFLGYRNEEFFERIRVFCGNNRKRIDEDQKFRLAQIENLNDGHGRNVAKFYKSFKCKAQIESDLNIIEVRGGTCPYVIRYVANALCSM